LELFTFDKPYVDRLRDREPSTEQHFVSYFGRLLDIMLRARRLSPERAADIRQETLTRVIAVESMRARALRSREVKLVDRICGLAHSDGYASVIQPGMNYIDLEKGNVRTRISYAIGIPDATNFESVIEKEEKCFLYDSANIRKGWSRHLEWLGSEFSDRLTTITPDKTLEFLREQSGVSS
jgi:hypothetical protein